MNNHSESASLGATGGPSTWSSYVKSPFRSVKHTTYFDVYDSILERFVGMPVTFVEVGVLGGGSLFMWRDYLGPDARIIGIDLNPEAKKWERSGFEIFIGNQADPAFWDQVLGEIGPIHVLLDDGGHTYLQQAVTYSKCLPSIVDGGVLVVEDTHTSYMRGFGPSKFSFIAFAKKVVDANNRRFGKVSEGHLSESCWSVQFFESFVVFHVDRAKASRDSMPTDNGGKDDFAEDYRDRGSRALRAFDKLGKTLNAERFILTRWLFGGLRARVRGLTNESAILKRLFRDL